MQTYFHGLWDLLPSFCRFPTDTSKSFGVLSKLLIATLGESPSLHETIVNAVQVSTSMYHYSTVTLCTQLLQFTLLCALCGASLIWMAK